VDRRLNGVGHDDGTFAAAGGGQPGVADCGQGMTAFATITRRALLSHRDGATMVSGTYLTDPGVLRGQEARLASLARQGFTVADVVRAYQLLYSFTIGFCIEEQAVAQAGDDRYSLTRRPPSETPPQPVNRV
jgi:hypothetical protein